MAPECLLLRRCHEICVTKPCQGGARHYVIAIELQIPFVFFGALVVGAAVLLMANSRQELVLLGAVFLVGFTSLQMSISLGGF